MNNTQSRSAKEWIAYLNLTKHPEGGWFKETYRSRENIDQKCLPGRFSGNRSFSTAIYFLLKENEFSAFHSIKQDEVWHFHSGSPLTIHIIDQNTKYRELNLGLFDRAQPQLVVKAGCLFAAAVKNPDSFTLVSCTVAPGFDFADFNMPAREKLLDIYPQYKSLIMKFSRG